MKRTGLLRLLVGLLLSTGVSMATEEAPYVLVESDKRIEIRDYAPQIVAETTVNASQEDAGNIAFRRLFGYISGNNTKQSKIAMTSPVGQLPASEKLDVSLPLTRTEAANSWIVSFMMPAAETMDTLPTPASSEVRLRSIPARRMVAIRYSGNWSRERYEQHRRKLEEWIEARRLETDGDAQWARYNSPFMPSFMRRNEVMIPVKMPDRGE